MTRNVLVIGGAGYVGSALVPKLLSQGHEVRVLDLFIYGDEVLESSESSPSFSKFKGDMRDKELVERAVAGCDTVIHLACISNDPSFELDSNLGKSINYDCLPMIVETAKKAGVNRFVFASSSSVYGIKSDPNVTEDLPLEPLTDYSKYKALGEEIVLGAREPGFNVLVLRPATVCGYSPRQRLDLVVNILTNHAFHNGKIKVFGGAQMRPNIHIDDMTDLYCQAMKWADEQIDGKIYNAGYENQTVSDIAEAVKTSLGQAIEVEVVPTDDNRSYHISSAKIEKELGFKATRTLNDAVSDLAAAFRDGKLPGAMEDSRYFNVKRMQELELK